VLCDAARGKDLYQLARLSLLDGKHHPAR
jgi:hypothetical protein